MLTGVAAHLYRLYSQSCISGRNCPDGINITHYIGNNSVTDGGRICQRWSLQTPHSHYFKTDEYFPLDSSLDDAANYCRNHHVEDPWCFTTDPHLRWEYCYGRICGGIVIKCVTLITHFTHVRKEHISLGSLCPF